MGKLINCKDCGNQISKKADKCPHCGAKNKRTSPVTMILGGIFGLGVLGAVIGGGNESGSPAAQQQPSVGNQTNQVQQPTEEIPNWQYHKEVDEMRGKTLYLGRTTSTNTVQFDFPYNGGSQLSIQLRKSPQFGNDVMFVISKGQFSCGIGGCDIKVKFGDGEILNYPVAEAEAGSSDVLFLNGSKQKFVTNLKKYKTVMIEADFYNYGAQQFKFDTSGLDW